MLTILAQDIRVMEGFGQAEYVGHTTIHPLGLAVVLACGLAVLLVPRRFALWPFIITVCFVAPSQRIIIAGLDFNFLRLLVIFGCLRLMLRCEAGGFVSKTIDRWVVAWALVGSAAYVALAGNSAAFIFRCGWLYDILGMYFLFRCLMRDWDDLRTLFLGFALASIPVALAFLVENSTSRNLFAFFGGLPEITPIREGRVRCRGAFGNAIGAGCFWAGIAPLVASLWWAASRWKWLGVASTAMCVVIIYCCASSTPVLALLAATIGGAAFFVRHQMRSIRWGILLGLIGLHMVMKAPVWHLVSRVSAVGGSTGYFRYLMIDHFIRRVGEWWLIGTRSTAHWFYGAQDLTNWYVYQGVTGGLATLVLFVGVIALAYGSLGRMWRYVAQDRARLAMVWAVGVSLFAHNASFIGISYTGSSAAFFWVLTLAMIGSLTPCAGRRARPGVPPCAPACLPVAPYTSPAL